MLVVVCGSGGVLCGACSSVCLTYLACMTETVARLCSLCITVKRREPASIGNMPLNACMHAKTASRQPTQPSFVSQPATASVSAWVGAYLPLYR